MEIINTISDTSSDIVFLEQFTQNISYFNDIRVEFLSSINKGITYDMPIVMQEGFFDFMTNVKVFIDRFIKMIKDTMTKFINFIKSLFLSNKKFIEVNKDRILAKAINFDYFGYRYTITDDMPDVSQLDKIISLYNSKIATIRGRRLSEVTDEEIAFFRKINDTRGKILRAGRPVDDYEFTSVLHALLRDNATDKVRLHIDNFYIRKIIDEYMLFTNILPKINKLKEKTLNQLYQLRSFFDDKSLKVYDGFTSKMRLRTLSNDVTSLFGSKPLDSYERYDVDVHKVVSAYMDLYSKQVKIIGSIIMTCFYEKINAINECLKQIFEIYKIALSM